jgi:hypothetical protein
MKSPARRPNGESQAGTPGCLSSAEDGASVRSCRQQGRLSGPPPPKTATRRDRGRPQGRLVGHPPADAGRRTDAELADVRLGPAGTPDRPGAPEHSRSSDGRACAPGHGLRGGDAAHQRPRLPRAGTRGRPLGHVRSRLRVPRQCAFVLWKASCMSAGTPFSRPSPAGPQSRREGIPLRPPTPLYPPGAVDCSTRPASTSGDAQWRC